MNTEYGYTCLVETGMDCDGVQYRNIGEPIKCVPIAIDKEIAVIASRNENGQIINFPTVEMEFSEEANLVEQLICPSSIPNEIDNKAQKLAMDIIDQLNMVGNLAVEFFISKEGEILVNEVAPRPHNSGHHTIEANLTSQFEQHLRAILNFAFRTDLSFNIVSGL